MGILRKICLSTFSLVVLAAATVCGQVHAPLENATEDSMGQEDVIKRVQTLLDSALAVASERPDRALIYCLRAQEYEAQLQDQPMILIELHRHFASALANMGAYVEAINHDADVLRVLQKMDDERHRDIYLTMGRMGSFYLRAGMKDSALAIFRRANPVARIHEVPVYIAASYNNLGIAFAAHDQADSAIANYERALRLLENRSPEEFKLMASIRDNLAELALKNGDLPEALSLYKIIYFTVRSKRNSDQHRLVTSGMGAASLLIHFNRYDEADGILGTVDSLLLTSNFVDKTELRRRFYAERYNWHANQGNRKEALYFAQLLNEAGGRLLKQSEERLSQTLKVLNQYKLANVRNVRKINELILLQKSDQLLVVEQEAFIRKLWIIFISIAALAMFGFGFWFYRKKINFQVLQQELVRLELRNKKLEGEKLKNELESRKKDLTEFALDNTRKREWAQELLTRLGELKGLPTDRLEVAIRQLTLDMNNQLMVEERLQLFQENVDHVNQEFYRKLNTNFEDLTKSEKELCGLIRLNLSGKEIANIRNVEPRSVTKSKNRLRKKLRLAPYQDLYEFLQEL